MPACHAGRTALLRLIVFHLLAAQAADGLGSKAMPCLSSLMHGRRRRNRACRFQPKTLKGL
ncbi:hypothetical protein BEN74_07110 [Acinetobacter sp. WCHAc010034]|nr:hypothetical protein BEN74_07110 [Acinetobacter sp. WCHAc010034]